MLVQLKRLISQQFYFGGSSKCAACIEKICIPLGSSYSRHGSRLGIPLSVVSAAKRLTSCEPPGADPGRRNTSALMQSDLPGMDFWAVCRSIRTPQSTTHPGSTDLCFALCFRTDYRVTIADCLELKPTDGGTSYLEHNEGVCLSEMGIGLVTIGTPRRTRRSSTISGWFDTAQGSDWSILQSGRHSHANIEHEVISPSRNGSLRVCGISSDGCPS